MGVLEQAWLYNVQFHCLSYIHTHVEFRLPCRYSDLIVPWTRFTTQCEGTTRA